MSELDRILREGAALHDAGRYEEALALYDKAADCWPNLALLWNNRGNTLLEMQRWPEAAESYHRALKLAPGLHDSRVALATCLQAMGHLREALALCDAVLRSSPEHAEAHWNRALLLLLRGDYKEGWQEYEWRWKKRLFTSPARTFDIPKWRGESLTGKTIFIHAEQGLGDTLQFCRYLPLLRMKGAKVIFECHPPLAHLMSTLGDRISVVTFGQPSPSADYHLPLLSMPLLFNTTLDNIPNEIPYIYPPADRLPFWHTVVPREEGRRVGLCWSGKQYPDPARSVPAWLIVALSACPRISFFSLQMGENTENPDMPIHDLTTLISDFADTAALISQLDLVITIDTSVAHLAGALGAETWLILPFSPDWRWGIGKTDSPWYPGMRIFRQQKRGDWGTVIGDLIEALVEEQ